MLSNREVIETWQDNYNQELYHYGIKGQKWGIRRFQKKDGTLTSEGKKRYSDESTTKSKSTTASSHKKIKVTHRDVLEKKYRDSGMSPEEAKAAADKRIKVEKAVAITAGLTVAACAAYYAKNKYAETYCDQVLKAGTTFHNLDSTANPRPGEHLYVNYRQNDVNYFRGHFAVGKMRKTGQVFNHTLTANEDIKIPSLNTRKNVFKQLYDNDEQFRAAFNEHRGFAKGKNSANFTYKNMWKYFGDKNTPEFNEAKHKYFEALRQKGYEAIVDEWDTSKGVFRSDAPLILLNTSSKSFGDMSIKELTDRDILLSQANARHYRSSRDFLNALGTPHTNHFKESGKHLSRYASRSEQNRKNIEKAIEAMTAEGSKYRTVYDLHRHAKSREGDLLADVGKYLNSNKNMTLKEAFKKADRKQDAKKAIEGAAALGIMMAPATAISKAGQSSYVKQYMLEHPNTKLSYKQIKQMYGYNDRVRKYIEEHPNTELSTKEIMKMYYGL